MEQKQHISRLGMFTASSIYKLMVKSRTKGQLFGNTALTYIEEKVAEIITGEPTPSITNRAMEWGNENEYDAAEWFVKHYHEFDYYGKLNFIFNEYNEYSGASPDGLYDNGVIEIKCPFNSSNHIGFLLNASNPDYLFAEYPDYYAQVQFNMMCANKTEAKLVSYDPRAVEPRHRMAVLYIAKNEEYCAELSERINAAVDIVKDMISKIG